MSRITRILKESLKGFFVDKCFLHASSLTFYSMLSLVPVLAVAFGLGKGFGFEKSLEQELYERSKDHAEVVKHVIEFSRSLLEQVEGGLIAGIGAILLFIFVISLFWTIENSMNTIWKVKRCRTPLRMITDYLAMMVICPLFFAVASSLMVFLLTQVDLAIEQHPFLQTMTPVSLLFYRGLTLVMIWVLFSSLYIIMPNTKVRARYGICAGIIAGTLYYVIQSAFIKFQIGVSQYNTIYGSFAALPLFLFWMQLSWISVLLGAELAYNTERLAPLMGAPGSSMEVTRGELALMLTQRLVQRFRDGLPPESVHDVSTAFSIPTSTALEILFELQRGGVISEISSDNSGRRFQPALALPHITIQCVVATMDPNTLETLTIPANHDAKRVHEAYLAYAQEAKKQLSNVPLSSLD